MSRDWNLDALESRCFPAVTILLDVDGEDETRWMKARVPATPAPLIDVPYILDRVRAAFVLFPSIRFAIETGPASRTAGPVVIIGGDGAWYRPSMGGVSQVGVLNKKSGDKRAWVFSDNLIGPEHIARLIVHEVGHMIGLPHTPGDSYMGAPFSRFALWTDQDAWRLSQLK